MPDSPPPTAPNAVDSAALAKAIAAGSEAAFAAFYAAWFGSVLALARASSRRDEAFCLDVVQDVMLVVAKKLPALRSERAVRAWMSSSVLHAISDRLRGERRRLRREQWVATEASAQHDAEPWLLMAAGERQQWLSARVQELPVSDQALLSARFHDGESVAATGARFGLGEDAAHGRLRRVLERLRHAAAEWLHG